MTEKQKSPSSGDVLERAAEKGLGGTSSTSSFSTAASDRQQGIVETLLPHGEGNAISTAALVALIGRRSARELQKGDRA